MTDIERERINTICEVAGISEIDDLSDGFHTFRQLYYQRMMLFAVIVKQNKDMAWKSLRHEDGELCFGGGWFIVGIDTPEGSYTYHYENKYFDLFDCEILDYGKHWDGHTEKDVTRLLSLQDVPDINVGGTISRQQAIDAIMGEYPDAHYPDWYASKIRALPSVQPYTAEEIDKMQELESAQLEKAYELGRESAQPEERTEKRTETHACDLISRQAAIDGKISIQCANGVEIYSDEAVPVEYLKALPSAQSERKTGTWIPQDFNKSDGMKTTTVYYFPKCSVCGYTASPTNYCPHCGADMKGSD